MNFVLMQVEAQSNTGESLLVAIIGGLALILVAIIPLLVSSLKQGREGGKISGQMPPNGALLWEMVEGLQHQVAKTEYADERMKEAVDRVERTVITLETTLLAHMATHERGRG
jgi:hypothetical protein